MSTLYDFTLKTIEGTERSLGDYDGKTRLARRGADAAE